MVLEVIATTVCEAIQIEQAGADRIELVSSMKEGGLTPSISLIKQVCDKVSIPVNVIVRPHAKSFVYDKYDKQVILNDIIEISKTKANGIVFGALTNDNEIDFDLLEKVIAEKKHLKLTFHRAIDRSKNILLSTKQLMNYNIDYILSSGGEKTAMLGINNLIKMNELAIKHNKKIIAGAGITLENIALIKEKTNIFELHIGRAARFENNIFNNIDQNIIKTIKKTNISSL